METMRIYDTTLRDGTQGENISFSADEKLAIARRLDKMGVHYVEGGWPGSNPRDMHFFDLARRETFDTTRLAAFGATRRPGIAVEDDANVRALIDSRAPAVAVFGKTWNLHVTQIMRNTLEENLAMISDTVSCLKSHGREVIYDAEHFFDGFRDDEAYALETLRAATTAGADWIVLCDTNGGSMVYDVEAATTRVKAVVDALGRAAPPGIGIHTHNDSAMAVANAIVAVRAGARMVHGTINGYGERCGNADLTALIPILKMKMGYDCISDANLAKLKNLSRFVSETANQVPSSSRPFVGRSAFAHKGGIHVNAIMKNPRAYEHMNPDTVGNRRRVLISDLAGKSNVEYKARELGVTLGGNEEITAAEGQGPVSALDNALRKALGRFFPDLDSMRLVDFKVRVIDGREGTEARVRVLIESRDQNEVWSTIGVSEDIIEASWQALADSFHYKLAKEQKARAAGKAQAATG